MSFTRCICEHDACGRIIIVKTTLSLTEWCGGGIGVGVR